MNYTIYYYNCQYDESGNISLMIGYTLKKIGFFSYGHLEHSTARKKGSSRMRKNFEIKRKIRALISKNRELKTVEYYNVKNEKIEKYINKMINIFSIFF